MVQLILCHLSVDPRDHACEPTFWAISMTTETPSMDEGLEMSLKAAWDVKQVNLVLCQTAVSKIIPLELRVRFVLDFAVCVPYMSWKTSNYLESRAGMRLLLWGWEPVVTSPPQSPAPVGNDENRSCPERRLFQAVCGGCVSLWCPSLSVCSMSPLQRHREKGHERLVGNSNCQVPSFPKKQQRIIQQSQSWCVDACERCNT